MTKLIRWSVILTITLISFQAIPQGGYFGSPLDTSILRLSGIYGELRPNHFHAGYDFKTGEKEGMKVLAAADGYVSRINISTGGYGKAIYITHDNGTTTVYGHLQKFTGEIASWVKQKQYEKESFTLELFPEADQFRVKKGQTIGFSGNSGSSGGPHLHFEIRETQTATPVHPYFYGFKLPDQIPPDLNGFRLYPADRNSLIEGKRKMFQAHLVKDGAAYSLKHNDTINVSGRFYLGFDATDRMNETSNIFGLYKAEVLVDGRPFYSFTIDSISFEETRYINSFVDYASVVKTKDWYQLTLIQPNNRLSVYDNVSENGIIEFTDSRVHLIRLILRDVLGNKSELTVKVRSHPVGKTDLTEFPSKGWGGDLFRWDTDNEFRSENVEVMVPKDALYDTIRFAFSASNDLKNAYSQLYKIHYETVPLHKRATLRIKPVNLNEKLKPFACMVRKKTNGDKIYAGSKWNGDFLETSISTFGDYFISADTIKPVIKPVNIPPTKKISGLKQLRYRISDDFSGIFSYRGTINGRWILMEYEPKSNLLFYDAGNELVAKNIQIIIEVTDNCGNTTRYKENLIK